MIFKNITFSTRRFALLTPRHDNGYAIYMQSHFGIIQYF